MKSAGSSNVLVSPRLRVFAVAGAVELRLVELGGDRFSIGRRPTSDLFLDDPSVSPEHALIRSRACAWVLHDLHHQERTRINGLPVRSRELVTGDLIEIGLFRLRYECGEDDPEGGACGASRFGLGD